jgi:predicted polyphosphate/ATP-dependent NAD kinase
MTVKTRRKRLLVNKSLRIREALAELGGDARNKDVIELLGKDNVVVSPAQVSNVRTALQRNGNGHAKRRKPDDLISVASLLQAKTFAARFGSIEEARRHLNAIEQLA